MLDESALCNKDNLDCPYYCKHNKGCSLRLARGEALKNVLEDGGYVDCEVYYNVSKVENMLADEGGLPTPGRSIEVIEAEINFYKQQTASGIIEIGKRLIEAKEQLPFGEWGNWLKEKVEFTDRTAQNMMRVAVEFSNAKAISDLGVTKVYALLDLPQEQREEFIESHPVEDMTTRELQKAIKAQKEAEKAKMEAEGELANAQYTIKIYNNQLNEARDNERRLAKELETEKDKKPEVIETTKVVEVVPPDYEQLKRKIAEMELESERVKNDANAYAKLKAQIENLKKEKDEFSRQVQAVTELSTLVVDVESFFKKELAPIKYSRAINEQKHDNIVQQNLRDIVNRVQDWCTEMYELLDKKYIDVEVNEYE